MTEYDGADVVIAAMTAKWDGDIITKPTGIFWGKLTSKKKVDVGLGDYCLAYEVDETAEKEDLFYDGESLKARVTVDVRSNNEQKALQLEHAARKAISQVRRDLSAYGGGIYLYALRGQRLNHSNRAIGLFHFTRDYTLVQPFRIMED